MAINQAASNSINRPAPQHLKPHSEPPSNPPFNSYYAVDYRISTRSTQTVIEQEAPRRPPPAAVELLAEAKTVAFAPPDTCLESANGTDIATQRCGEVMTALEQAASEWGFQVVSWQSLRGNEPALNYARRSNVDIIFELNRLGPDDALDGLVRNAKLTFMRYDNGHASSMAVSSQTRSRCATALLKSFPIESARNGVVLDVKMVSVKSGMVLWSYRHIFWVSIDIRDEMGVRYFDNVGDPDQIICMGSNMGSSTISTGGSSADSKPAPEAKSSQENFEVRSNGKPSSSSTLRRAAKFAASSFVELIALVQTDLSHSKKKGVTLQAPPRPQKAPPGPGCAQVAEWIKSDVVKERSELYLRICPQT